MCDELVRPPAVELSDVGNGGAPQRHVLLRVLALRLGVHSVRQSDVPPARSWSAAEVVLSQAQDVFVLPSGESLVGVCGLVLHRHGQRVPSLLFMPDRTVRVPEPGLVLPFLLSVLRRLRPF